MRTIAFDLFRYQILPKSRIFQPDLFGDIKTLQELLARKNDIFFDALKQVTEFRARKSVVKHKVLYEDGQCVLYRFAANRLITRETEQFTEEELANWPSFYVLVWNDPTKQFIAIQERPSAFRQTEVVARAIISTIDDLLGQYNLRAHVESLFLENVFWDLLKNNVGQIKDIKFELVTPNLANISNVLNDELKEFARNTNTAQTNVDIIADSDSSILIDENDEKVKGLVHYASQGGGNISIKIKGLSRRVHTKKSKKSIDINELELTSRNPERIAKIVKDLLS